MAEPTDGADYVVAPTRLNGPVVLVEYSEDWPTRYEEHASRIRGALGPRAVLVEHIGSTSVPGLAAKPIIDICLAVPDSAAEETYVPDLEAAGYLLQLREPGWHEHRLLRRTSNDVNLHVFTVGSSEITRCLLFRDHLRSRAEDRQQYETTKRRLAAQHWDYLQDYADAKGQVVEAILQRTSSGSHSTKHL